jgi:2,3-bisphosphoglycerate-dependent phosphoglycerate mutase
MIERSYGDYEGTTHAQIIEKYGNRELGEKMLHEIRRLYDFQPPNGESVKMVEGRVLPFIHDLIEFMKKNKVNVAISAHGNSMRPFRRYFEKMNVDQMMKLENPWDNYFEYKIK